ncbi:MAG: hypothetical protein ACHQFW_03455, partial [Chitinophagales bacterium]
MQLNQFNDPEWDGSFEKLFTVNDLTIILLKFNQNGLRKEGRTNLLAINANKEIIWIAPPPSFGYKYDVYHTVKKYIYHNELYAWYGG